MEELRCLKLYWGEYEKEARQVRGAGGPIGHWATTSTFILYAASLVSLLMSVYVEKNSTASIVSEI